MAREGTKPSSSHLAHSPYSAMYACEQPAHDEKPDCGGVVHLPAGGDVGFEDGHHTAGGLISATSSAVM